MLNNLGSDTPLSWDMELDAKRGFSVKYISSNSFCCLTNTSFGKERADEPEYIAAQYQKSVHIDRHEKRSCLFLVSATVVTSVDRPISREWQ